jgi:hypothetical protein
MKRVLMIIAVLAVLAPAGLWAQDVPKAEVFGGFSFIRFGGDGDSTTAPGWHYKDGGSALEYLGGPRYVHRVEKASVFVHALYGGTHFSDGGGNHFTMAYGGGVDYNVKDNLAIRVVQFDWAPIKFEGSWEKNNVRFGFGVVFKSGSK